MGYSRRKKLSSEEIVYIALAMTIIISLIIFFLGVVFLIFLIALVLGIVILWKIYLEIVPPLIYFTIMLVGGIIYYLAGLIVLIIVTVISVAILAYFLYGKYYSKEQDKQHISQQVPATLEKKEENTIFEPTKPDVLFLSPDELYLHHKKKSTEERKKSTNIKKAEEKIKEKSVELQTDKYYCKECKKRLSKAQYEYCMGKLGIALCLKHQKQYKATPQEKKLYRHLQKLGVDCELQKWDGYKTIDIVIKEAKLNIEVDGSQHILNPKQLDADIKRTEYSQKKGWHTLRYRNREIDRNPSKVANAIAVVASKRKKELEKK